MKKMTMRFRLPFSGIERKPEYVSGGLPKDFKILNTRLDVDGDPSKMFTDIMMGNELPKNALRLEILCEFPVSKDGNWETISTEFMIIPERCEFDTKPGFTQWFNDKLGSMSIEERKSCIMPQSREEYVYIASVCDKESYSLYQKVYEFSVFDLNK